MSYYHFSLQRILEYRKMLYNKAVWQFSPFLKEWSRLEKEVVYLKQEEVTYFASGKRVTTLGEVYLRERYYESMRLKRVEIQRQQQKILPQYLEKREKILGAFQDLNFIKKLAKSSFDAYKGRVKKKNGRQLDDIIAMHYAIGEGGS